MWTNLVVVGIISTFAPAPGSIEVFVYTKLTPKKKWDWWNGRSLGSIVPAFNYYLLLGDQLRIIMAQLGSWNIVYNFHSSSNTWSLCQQKSYN